MIIILGVNSWTQLTSLLLRKAGNLFNVCDDDNGDGHEDDGDD